MLAQSTSPRQATLDRGLMVATIQLAITVGAGLGGMLFDSAGGPIDFLASAGVLVLASVAALVNGRLSYGLVEKRT